MLDCVTMHEQPPGALGRIAPAPPPVLVAVVAGVAEADRALAEGADLIDITGLAKRDAAPLRAHLPAARLWKGDPAAIDADPPGPDAASPDAADAADAEDSEPAAIAAAAIATWLGAPAIRSTHVRAVRRAIDMTGSVAGTRLPALTTRGLA